MCQPYGRILGRSHSRLYREHVGAISQAVRKAVRRTGSRPATARSTQRQLWLQIGGVLYLLTLLRMANALHPSTYNLFSSRRPGRITTSQRKMVLTTPEAIFEQASTTTLLDDLIDESVRTSARRPIMMQFDPSSGWIWKRWKGTIFSETWDSCVSYEYRDAAQFLLLSLFNRLPRWFTPALFLLFANRCRK